MQACVKRSHYVVIGMEVRILTDVEGYEHPLKRGAVKKYKCDMRIPLYRKPVRDRALI